MLRAATGKTVTFARAPSGGVPPFTVLQIISDLRPILTLDGGIPAEVTWQLDCFGETPLQAVALGDKAARAMALDAPPTLPGAYVTAQEALGEGSTDMIAEGRWLWQRRFRWTLVGTA